VHLPRTPDPLTGFDSADDLELSALCIGPSSDDNRAYWGPHLILNTTLNTSERGEIGAFERRCESFLLSPLYCGSASFGYARTEHSKPVYAVDPNLTLSRALAISGAADHLGIDSAPCGPLTALLTLFSARPGSWIEKPSFDGWAASSPRLGDLPVTASLGLSCKAGEFVYISGGDQFEPLGVYELIRRRCRYIVAVDAGDDGAERDANLAILIRRCQIDFGIRIEFKTPPLERNGTDRLSGARGAIGQVHYSDVDPGAARGVLVYVGLSMAHNEPSQLRLFARIESPPRWRTPRSREELDEQLFERYRSAGYNAARSVFEDVVARLSAEFPDLEHQGHVEFVTRLFGGLPS
jgi:hypothetical protein